MNFDEIFIDNYHRKKTQNSTLSFLISLKTKTKIQYLASYLKLVCQIQIYEPQFCRTIFLTPFLFLIFVDHDTDRTAPLFIIQRQSISVKVMICKRIGCNFFSAEKPPTSSINWYSKYWATCLPTYHLKNAKKKEMTKISCWINVCRW